ncbi:NADH:ubiquinone oxidoreductase subunit A [Kyrpidia spormannii]|uniref:NADH-quinone oxidoreductase subunit A n=2 Tax=Kyrpidia TaxID=1129704 RepID=A0A2K8NA20_9BACL|nr:MULTISPECIES: NADH-quinone oxidoreductase subunit A [Kyrpidia]ADG07515.1 NADH-ubiquinone/plastoquinone oxidoreductase chain 3 [Kyrpidia tusciae DSM 2912]ATY85965.1 NADH:ubiquinone oxidoreductase subunit A [Kyrpidia spormannii]MBE3552462.1 NADH-quinone oxidoreductase subunit A [Kyrpidia tusciae]MCL6576340.1 NADH-quinone oxidoreductase subunit A [Kyrpidia sp.]CAB3395899.1 NADH-quinone oxidoreductase subunit A [Kyrpidia spormannii]
MSQSYVTSVLLIALFVAIGVGLPIVAFSLSRLLRPHHAYREKGETYESGNLTVGTSWVRFHVKYYLFALLFVVFDVETLFLYPWAVAYDALGTFALAEVGIFLFILVFGLYYAWRQEVLEWK